MAASSTETYVIGWRLDPEERRQLLERIRPVYRKAIADHVTLASRVKEYAPLPTETGGLIVGQIDDDAGLQALVVEIGGTTGRPDGSTYHITWSLDDNRGREAVQSNGVLARLGWRPLPEPIPITLIPARF